jgi:predicted metal-dependent phosphotriesterase family hydrolase
VRAGHAGHTIVPRLLEAGVTQEQVDRMMVANLS